MCAEASTVLRAVAVDFFFTCWYLESLSDNRIRHVPSCVHYHAQGFQLETFQIFYVGSDKRCCCNEYKPNNRRILIIVLIIGFCILLLFNKNFVNCCETEGIIIYS
jgi:hypothetical protein